MTEFVISGVEHLHYVCCGLPGYDTTVVQMVAICTLKQ
jgi:hypothetical protein